jgi:CubicO group peptidase (beta-lactamase class C family)
VSAGAPSVRNLITSLAGWLILSGPCFASAPGDGSSWQGLEAELQALQRRGSVPVLMLVIVEVGSPALVTVSTLEGDAGFGRDTPFRWGSISKTVTSLVVLEAVRGQGVGLATPIGALLDELPFRNPWAPRHPLRLAHLLEQSAGLPDLSQDEFADNTPLPLATALARNARRRVLLWPPGLQHSYSNVPPGIAAAVVERLTGAPFEEAARSLVFSPLGMTAASYAPVPGLPGGFAADGRRAIPYWHMTFPASGGLNASPAAMSRLLEALLDGGRVDGRQAVAAESVARMFRAETTLGTRHGLEIGYGAGLYGWVRNGHVFHGHGGDADGYRARLGLLPAAGRGYLLGINVDDPSLLRRMQRLVEQALIVDLAPPAVPGIPALPPATLARYAGSYHPSSTRFRVVRWQAGDAPRARISVEDGHLRFLRRGRAQRLLPVAVDRFRREGDPAVSVVFAEQEGILYMQGELGNFARE